MIRAGASGYLIKDSTADTLYEAIDKVRHGHIYISSPSREGHVVSQESVSRDRMAAAHYSLTRREVEVLTLIAAGHSVRRIADDLGISIYTVHTHRRNIMSKLGFTNNAELIRYALLHDLKRP